MKLRLRLLLALLAVLLPALALASWRASTMRELDASLEPRLPERIGGWSTTRETELEAEILAVVQPISYAMRLYQAPDREAVWLYIGMYGARAGQAGAHEPSVCYPAQGWEVIGSRTVVVPLDGASMDATLLQAYKGGRRESVLYWFQPSGRWPSHGAVEQLLQLADAVLGRPHYVFVRLSSGEVTQGASSQQLIEFASELAPQIRAELERLLGS